MCQMSLKKCDICKCWDKDSPPGKQPHTFGSEPQGLNSNISNSKGSAWVWPSVGADPRHHSSGQPKAPLAKDTEWSLSQGLPGLGTFPVPVKGFWSWQGIISPWASLSQL